MNGHGDGDGAGTGTGMEVNEEAQDGNGDGAGTGTGTGGGSVDEHRMGTGTEARTVAEMGTGTTIAGTGTGIGSGRAEERRKSAKNRKIVVDAVRKTGETRVKRERNVEKKGVGSEAANPDNLESNKEEEGGEYKVLRAQARIVQVEGVCPLCRG